MPREFASQQGVKLKSAGKLWNFKKWRLFFSANLKLKGSKKPILAKLKTTHNIVITLEIMGISN